MAKDYSRQTFRDLKELFPGSQPIKCAIAENKKFRQLDDPTEFQMAQVQARSVKILLEQCPERVTESVAVTALAGIYLKGQVNSLFEDDLIEIYGEETWSLIAENQVLLKPYKPGMNPLEDCSSDAKLTHAAMMTALLQLAEEDDPDFVRNRDEKGRASSKIEYIVRSGEISSQSDGALLRAFERVKRRRYGNLFISSNNEIRYQQNRLFEMFRDNKVITGLLDYSYQLKPSAAGHMIENAVTYLDHITEPNPEVVAASMIRSDYFSGSPLKTIKAMFVNNRKTVVEPLVALNRSGEIVEILGSDIDKIGDQATTDRILDLANNYKGQIKTADSIVHDVLMLGHLKYFKTTPLYEDQNELERTNARIVHDLLSKAVTRADPVLVAAYDEAYNFYRGPVSEPAVA